MLRAFDRTAQMPVAVKLLRSELAKDERWVQRFSRELRLGRPIRHPNVCRIFDIGEADGHKFLTMELASDGTLRDLIKNGQPLRPLPERMADAQAAIAGLAAIHEAGIVHRDVKPDNMLRMEDGRLALSDFGLATDLSNTGTVTVMVGTPHYMAPEIRAGEPATTRSDVWSLGVVLYEIFFGLRPERKSSRSQAGMSKPPPLLTSTPLERAMLALSERCLDDDPFERPEDAREVENLFRSATASPRRFQRLRRKGRIVLFGAVVGLTIVVAAGLFSWSGRRPRGARPTPMVNPTGVGKTWDASAAIAKVAGKMHCLSLIDERTVRLIWGSPRRAEEIDIKSGSRRPSRLDPEAYQTGCPELSQNGRALLFGARNSVGAMEIRLSEQPDGRSARVMTPGADPLWFRGDDEFVYSLDATHAAVFSRSTMTWSLLPGSGRAGREMIAEMATSPLSDRVALLVTTSPSDCTIAVHGGPGLDRQVEYSMPTASKIAFTDAQHLLVAYDLSRQQSALALLDLDSGEARRLGQFPDVTLMALRPLARGGIVGGRNRMSDVWLHHGAMKQRLTTDGQNTSAAISSKDDLLLGKIAANGGMTVWYKPHDGAIRQVTHGTSDAMPDFSPDGRKWVYSDFTEKAIVLCDGFDGACAPFRREDRIPICSQFSPDGQRIAYLTEFDQPRVVVVSVQSGEVRQLGAANRHFQPIWSSNTMLWSLGGSPGKFFWVEQDVTTGMPTGRRVEGEDSVMSPDGVSCRMPARGPAFGSPVKRVVVEEEETSFVLPLPPS